MMRYSNERVRALLLLLSVGGLFGVSFVNVVGDCGGDGAGLYVIPELWMGVDGEMVIAEESEMPLSMEALMYRDVGATHLIMRPPPEIRDEWVWRLAGTIESRDDRGDVRCLIVEQVDLYDGLGYRVATRAVISHVTDSIMVSELDITRSRISKTNSSRAYFEGTAVPYAVWQPGADAANGIIGVQTSERGYGYGTHSTAYYLVSIYDGDVWRSRLFAESTAERGWAEYKQPHIEERIEWGMPIDPATGGVGIRFGMLLAYLESLNKGGWIWANDLRGMYDVIEGRE